MTSDEYNKKLIELKDEYEIKKKELAKSYALSNNPYKVGDVITDHICTIKIDKIVWTYNYFGNPCCAYFGVELKKNGEPKKNNPVGRIHQTNILPTPQP